MRHQQKCFHTYRRTTSSPFAGRVGLFTGGVEHLAFQLLTDYYLTIACFSLSCFWLNMHSFWIVIIANLTHQWTGLCSCQCRRASVQKVTIDSYPVSLFTGYIPEVINKSCVFILHHAMATGYNNIKGIHTAVWIVCIIILYIIYVRVASRNRTLARNTVLRKWPIKITERKSSFFRRPKVLTSSYWWEIVVYSLLAKGRNAKKRKTRVSKNRTRQ